MFEIPSERLGANASRTRRLASKLCHIDERTGRSCAGYHGFWQVLRLLRLSATAAEHAELFSDALARMPKVKRAPRILISGAADSGMLYLLLSIMRSRGIDPEFTLVDICETPLEINREYARRAGARLSTHRCDIIEFRSRRTFDAICAHAFFSQIAQRKRRLVVENWRRLLRPGGVVAAVDRIRPGRSAQRVEFERVEKENLRDAVLRRAAELPTVLRRDLSMLARDAENYAVTHRPYRVASVDAVRKLFEEGTFSVDRLSRERLVGASGRTGHGAIGGRIVLDDFEYALVIASRPRT